MTRFSSKIEGIRLAVTDTTCFCLRSDGQTEILSFSVGAPSPREAVEGMRRRMDSSCGDALCVELLNQL
jgi:hypothetical protein